MYCSRRGCRGKTRGLTKQTRQSVNRAAYSSSSTFIPPASLQPNPSTSFLFTLPPPGRTASLSQTRPDQTGPCGSKGCYHLFPWLNHYICLRHSDTAAAPPSHLSPCLLRPTQSTLSQFATRRSRPTTTSPIVQPRDI